MQICKPSPISRRACFLPLCCSSWMRVLCATALKTHPLLAYTPSQAPPGRSLWRAAQPSIALLSSLPCLAPLQLVPSPRCNHANNLLIHSLTVLLSEFATVANLDADSHFATVANFDTAADLVFATVANLSDALRRWFSTVFDTMLLFAHGSPPFAIHILQPLQILLFNRLFFDI